MADVHYKFDRGGVAGLQDDSAVLTSDGDVRDYFALLKPRVMSLVIFTALVGIVVAPGTMHPVLAFVALLCIAVGAGASGALNMWYDADIDGEMQRTAARPIPRGLVTAQDALSFGTFLSFASVITLGMLVNWLSAAVLAFTIGFYLFIYTMWLKRKTPYNIVIGGAAGAFPPLLGWVAATGSLSVEPVVLFAIIFLWTPPHSWALALFRNRDYTKVSVPMLPVVSGRDETRRQIWLYSLPMVVVAMAPYVMGFAGIVYAVVVAAASAFFLKLAWTLYRTDDEKEGDKIAKQLFGFSILWMLLVFAVLLAEHAFGLGGFVPTFVGGGA